MTQRASQITSNLEDHSSRTRGFTIVELLIVIVVIGILATLVIVAYNGIRSRAEDASLQSETGQAARKVLAYKAENSDILPDDMAAAGFTAASGREVFYRVTPDGKNFCVAVNVTGSPTRAFSATSTNPAAKKGTCQGYILVPGNQALGTNDFWVMKYEAKNLSDVATSQAASAPWVQISQTNAISTSQATCDGCHLISEAEWMTLAGNVLGVSSNWSGGSVGSGYIYRGHTDNSPANSLQASSTDSDGYNGTGQTTGNQRRTLTLSNGEVIWDMAGNVWEWTSGTTAGGQPGGPESGYTWREWNAVSIAGSLSPTPFPASVSPAAAAFNSAHGIGQLRSDSSRTVLSPFIRGGDWNGSNSTSGVFAMIIGDTPSYANSLIGFRVAR